MALAPGAFEKVAAFPITAMAAILFPYPKNIFPQASPQKRRMRHDHLLASQLASVSAQP
jgi:hypothetical protein